MTAYPGIDYSLNRTNIDTKTGIRYGCISQHSILPEALEDGEYDYGSPHCPKCGRDADRPADFGETFLGGKETEGYTSQKYEESEFVCLECQHFFGSESAFGDDPVGWSYRSEEYRIESCLDSDIMVIQSPYYTHAQFCSPCVPGAGNLDCPCLDGPRTYCLGHDWFEFEAPYPVYDVGTGEKVEP